MIAAAGSRWRHFHASEPHLVPLGQGGVDHAAVASALRSAGYERWVSVEMAGANAGGSWRQQLESAVATAAAYAGVPPGR
jgi:sugar phosphate isomerase/epimerase